MKNALRRCLTGLTLFGTIAFFGYSQTAKDVLDKMIEAQGGRKALENVKDTTISGSIEMIAMGINGSMTIYQKEPDKMRLDMEFMGMIITQACDGEKTWMTDPQSGALQEMTANQSEDFKKQALGNDAALHPEKYGISYAFKGKEKIQDKEYLVLEQTYKDGQKITMDLDPATYLVYKSKGKSYDPATGGEIESETILGDYKKVGDVTVAHSMSIFQNGTEAIRMTFVKVTFNTGLDDTLFKMSK